MTSTLLVFFLLGSVGVHADHEEENPPILSGACLQAYNDFTAAESDDDTWAMDLCDPTHGMNVSLAQMLMVCNDTDLYWEEDANMYLPVPTGLQMLSSHCLPCGMSVNAWSAATGEDWEFDYSQFCDPSDPVNSTAQSVLATCEPDEFPDENGVGFVQNLQNAMLGCNPCFMSYMEMNEECDLENPNGSLVLHICLNTTMCYQKIVAAEATCAVTNFVTDDGGDVYGSVLAIKQWADTMIMYPDSYCNDCNLAYLYMEASPVGCEYGTGDCASCYDHAQEVLDECTAMSPPQSYMDGSDMPSAWDWSQKMNDFQDFVDGCNGVGPGQCIQIPMATAQALNTAPCP